MAKASKPASPKQKVFLGILLVLLLIVAAMQLGGGDDQPQRPPGAVQNSQGGGSATSGTTTPSTTNNVPVPPTRSTGRRPQRMGPLDADAALDGELSGAVKDRLLRMAEEAARPAPDANNLISAGEINELTTSNFDPFKNRSPNIESKASGSIERLIRSRYKLHGVIGHDSDSPRAQLNDDDPRRRMEPVDDTGFWVDEIGRNYVILRNSAGNSVRLEFAETGRRR